MSLSGYAGVSDGLPTMILLAFETSQRIEVFQRVHCPSNRYASSGNSRPSVLISNGLCWK